jgi:hypothetical protein
MDGENVKVLHIIISMAVNLYQNRKEINNLQYLSGKKLSTFLKNGKHCWRVYVR